MKGPARAKDGFSLVCPLLATADGTKPEAVDLTGALHRAVLQQKDDEWRCGAIMKPYRAFDARLSSSELHTIPNVTVPPLRQATAYPLRMVFTLSNGESLADIPAVDRLVCETHIIDTMRIFDFDHEERDEFNGVLVTTVKESVWRLVGGVDRHCIAPVLPPQMSKRQIDFLICETIFSQMFQLPASPLPMVQYGHLLGNLIRLDPLRRGRPFVTTLNDTIHEIYSNLDRLDVQCMDTFSSWFALHLSNVNPAWSWDWSKWVDVLDLPATAPRRLWVQDLLDRCVRLSFREVVKRALVGPAESLQELLPPEANPSPFKYEEISLADKNTTVPVGELREQILGESRKPPKEIATWLQEQVLPDCDEADKEVLLDVAIRCCLKVGSDPTHLTAIVARQLPVLQCLGARDRKNIDVVLRAVSEHWADSHHHLILTVLRLLAMRIIPSPAALIAFVFSDDNVPHLARSHWWQIIRTTLAKTIARSRKVQSDLAAAKEALHNAPDPVDADDDGEMSEEDEEDDDKEKDDSNPRHKSTSEAESTGPTEAQGKTSKC